MPDQMKGPRLSLAAKRLVYRLIVAGDSNDKIRESLFDAGHPQISDRSLSKYRARDFIRRAIDARDEEAAQEGAARYGERLRILSKQVRRLEHRLATKAQPEEFHTGTVVDVVMLSRELRDTLSELDQQIHRASTRRAGRTAKAVTTGQEAPGQATQGEGVLLLPDNGKVSGIPEYSET